MLLQSEISESRIILIKISIFLLIQIAIYSKQAEIQDDKRSHLFYAFKCMYTRLSSGKLVWYT